MNVVATLRRSLGMMDGPVHGRRIPAWDQPAASASCAGSHPGACGSACARRAGIGGVPCFIFNRRHALAGAHPPEVLHQLFDLAIQDEAAEAEA